ncbi:PTS sugar transporter subunit IIA [Candidatus Clostridium radicumherbarum]|uniref:PTS sugar transporter subunit IIA n=1 Tax=Candidatus Clostridium radicumherbarum TaxID=3381662 RepID=A0ABW8TQP4_9CLOT
MSKLNIVVGTHGRFGEELIKSAEMIVGKMENVKSVSLLPMMSFEEFMQQADSVLSDMEGPVLALVDLYGGTPCNVLSALTRKYHHNVITGVNLPMLVELYVDTINKEELDMEEVVKNCIEILKSSGVHTNKMLE